MLSSARIRARHEKCVLPLYSGLVDEPEGKISSPTVCASGTGTVIRPRWAEPDLIFALQVASRFHLRVDNERQRRSHQEPNERSKGVVASEVVGLVCILVPCPCSTDSAPVAIPARYSEVPTTTHGLAPDPLEVPIAVPA